MSPLGVLLVSLLARVSLSVAIRDFSHVFVGLPIGVRPTCTVGEDGKRISMAEQLYIPLSDESRCNGGLKGTVGNKHAKREANAKNAAEI